MSTAPSTGPQRDFTDRDMQLKPILKFSVAILLFTVATFATVAYVQVYWEKQAAAADARLSPMSTERQLPSQAVLQVTEVKDLAAHRAWESNLTTNYAVVDQAAGIYRIPVDRAIEILAARGLPREEFHQPVILRSSIFALLLALAAHDVAARGRFSSGELPVPEPPAPAILKRAGFEQKLGAQVPMDVRFRNEAGETRTLREFASGKPVILNLAYFGCPMLCTEVVNGMMEAVAAVPYAIGGDYAILTVSFDPKEGPQLAAEKKANYLKSLGRDDAGAGWHFLTGDEAAIRAVTESVGFTYAWDEVGKQYGHASGIVVLTPDGKISHYFYGVRYPAKDLRLALADASDGKIGGPVEKLLLFCFHYDAKAGKYSVAVMNLIRAGGLATLLALGILIIPTFRRSANRAARPVVGRDAGGTR